MAKKKWTEYAKTGYRATRAGAGSDGIGAPAEVATASVV